MCRLPTKTLVQCQLVCKSWRRYSHLSRDLFSRIPTCLLLQDSSTRTYKSLTLLDLKSNLNQDQFTVLKFRRDVNPIYNHQFLDIAGSCNGFLFLYNNCSSSLLEDRYYISNPLTRESLSFQETTDSDNKGRYWVSGFGFSPISNAYKAVGFKPVSDQPVKLEVRVLTIGSGIWRSIANSVYYIHYLSGGVYLNGFLHWIGRSLERSHIICAFDVERECFQELPLPPSSMQFKLKRRRS